MSRLLEICNFCNLTNFLPSDTLRCRHRMRHPSACTFTQRSMTAWQHVEPCPALHVTYTVKGRKGASMHGGHCVSVWERPELAKSKEWYCLNHHRHIHGDTEPLLLLWCAELTLRDILSKPLHKLAPHQEVHRTLHLKQVHQMLLLRLCDAARSLF